MSTLNYAINGQPETALNFYKVACHPQRHAVVEACAGAGKTWILVARMARALLEGADPDSILAITFTKKAAAEMRNRLMQLLQEWSQATDAEIRLSLEQRGMEELDQSTIEQARGVYQRLLESEREVQVKTFHSWFAQLVRLAPMEALRGLGLPPQYDLLEDDQVLKDDAWPLFLERVSTEPDLIADFRAAVEAAGRGATQAALMNALDWRSELILTAEHGVLEGSVRAPLDVEPRWQAVHDRDAVLDAEPDLLEALFEVAKSLGRGGEAGRKKPTDSAIANATKLETALTNRDFPKMWSIFRKKDGERKVQGLSAVDPEVLEHAQDWLDSWARLKHQEACFHHQLRMSRLAKVLIDTYTQLKVQRRLIDMADLETVAVSLLTDGPASAWIQERLDQSLTQILIDEFQDTNPMQWRALQAWLGSYAGSDAGSHLRVFIVGDPKQSIYRFRRADPRVFQQATAFLVEGLGAQVLACDHTRRCAQGVVAALNAIMPHMPARGETAAVFRAHSTGSAQSGWVGRLPMVSKAVDASEASDSAAAEQAQADDQSARPTDATAEDWRDTFTQAKFEIEEGLALAEARAAAAWLKQALIAEQVEPADVMFLARRRVTLSIAHRALTEVGIASAFAEKSPLADAPVVRDVLALIEAATLQTSDIQLAQALRAPWMGARDEDLIALARMKKLGQYSSWWTMLTSGDLSAITPRLRDAGEWHDLCARWRQVCLRVSAQLNHLPVHDVLVALFDDLCVAQAYARHAPVSAKQNAQLQLAALLDASQNVNSGRFLTPLNWLDALKRRAQDVAWPMPTNSVKLMTVHGAKGLEAKWVVLLDTHQPPKSAESNGVLLDWPIDHVAPRRCVFVASEKRPPVCARELLEREQAAREAEDTNLLYVAMTRAEDRLVFSGKASIKNAERSWYRMAETVVEPVSPIGEAGASFGQAGDHSFTLKVLPRLTRVDIPRLVQQEPPPKGSDAAELELSARRGEAMHQLVQWWRPNRPWTEHQRRAIRSRWALEEADFNVAESMASAIVQGQAAWSWDSDQIEFALNETEMRWQGELLRLDRVVKRRDGMWWVLDFKSSSHPAAQPEYCEQILNYAQAWSDAHGGVRVTGALVGGDGHLWVVGARGEA